MIGRTEFLIDFPAMLETNMSTGVQYCLCRKRDAAEESQESVTLPGVDERRAITAEARARELLLELSEQRLRSAEQYRHNQARMVVMGSRVRELSELRASDMRNFEAELEAWRHQDPTGASIITAKGLAIAGITPRGSLARMVAARSNIKGGRSGECRDRTGADEGASGGKRHRTEQGQKAATHSHTAPCTTCQ